MNRKQIFQIFLAFLLLISCENSGNWKKEYLEIKQSYPSKLTSHFPKEQELKKDFFSHIVYPTEFAPLQYSLKQKESDATIDSLISGSIRIPYSDTSYYIVNPHLREDNYLSMPQNYDSFEIQGFEKNAVPIPNFHESSDFKEGNYHHLKEAYTIYLVDANAEKCCGEELHEGNWHMPGQWKDGYSKGYAINEEESEVIYWYVVW